MSGHIHHEVVLPASPERVYHALVDSGQFSAVTGGAATSIDREVGGSFSCFGGAISGRHIELVPGQRIVQAWRVGTWPEGVYSLARFDLRPESHDATRLVFDHEGFPEEQTQHLDAGWHARYWEPLRRFLQHAGGERD